MNRRRPALLPRLAFTLALLLACPARAAAQDDDQDEGFDDGPGAFGLTWSGTITLSEDVTWQVVPPNTITNASGSSITTRSDVTSTTRVSVTLADGVATATVAEAGATETSAVYAGCWNGRYAIGGESRFGGSTSAAVGVSMDEAGAYRISVGILGGVPGTNREYQTLEGPNSDCNGTTVDFEALGLPRGTVSSTTPGVSATQAFEMEGVAAPGATTVSGSAPYGRGGTVTYSLTASGCDGKGNDEAEALLARERPRVGRELGTQDSPPEDEGEDMGASLALVAARLPRSQQSSSQPVNAQTAGAAVQAAVGGGDRVALGDATDGGSGGLIRFGVRLGGGGRALPALEAIERLIATACVQPGSIEGSRVLLVGSVQWTPAGEFRINLRTVDVETGVVTSTASASGTGGAAELAAALGPPLGTLMAR